MTQNSDFAAAAFIEPMLTGDPRSNSIPSEGSATPTTADRSPIRKGAGAGVAAEVRSQRRSKEAPDMTTMRTGSTSKHGLKTSSATVKTSRLSPIELLRQRTASLAASPSSGQMPMARNYELSNKIDRIVERVEALSLTDLPVWAEVKKSYAGSRLFDFALNRPTFLPDEDGRFRGQAMITLHRDTELSPGHRAIEGKTLFATIVGHLVGDEVTIDDVRLPAA